MPFARRFTSRTVHGNMFARIVTLRRLLCQRLASRFDCTQTVFASAFGMQASQCRRLRLRTGSPHIAHAVGVLGAVCK
jgi:hypothetical protein